MMHEKLRDTLLANQNLTNLIANRVFPSIAPQNPTLPLVLYRQISRIYKHDMSGVDSLENARFQIDCYAKSLSETMTLCEGVREALDKKAFELSYFEDYENETSIYRITLDFSIFDDQI